MEELKGSLEHVVFHNEKNGYTVADFDIDGQLVTVVGSIEEPREGEYLKLRGTWAEHPTFGEQFKIIQYSIDTPSTEGGVIRYLSSGLLPGVGEKTAQAIVAHFGVGAIEILDRNPNRLTEIAGIGKKTVEKIIEAYADQREVREVVLALQEYGISTTYAMKLYRVYGQNTVKVLFADPYQIIKDVPGIGFKIADGIASQLGVTADNPKRIAASITQSLRECYASGNTYMDKGELINTSARVLGLELWDDSALMTIADQVEEMTLAGDLKLDFIGEAEAYYPMMLFEAEDTLALDFARMARYEHDTLDADWGALVEQYAQGVGIVLDPSQRDALMTALDSGVTIITGGPGTGKTTIVSGLIDILTGRGLSVVLAAPTGRAAKRMAEATGEEARTIHRLLEYEPTGDDGPLRFARDEDNPLSEDVVIVDEASMVDTLLMASLTRALSPGTKLILVGDVDQLPSVGPGQVLTDLIDSQVVPVVRLTAIHRQAKGSAIALAAQSINGGHLPEVGGDGHSDLVYLSRQSTGQALETILGLVGSGAGDGTVPGAPQIITPMKKGPLGTIALNAALQKALNPAAPEKNERALGNLIFREGDKVMQIKNDYKLKWQEQKTYESGEGIFNGDIGVITRIDTSGKTLTVHMDDDKVVDYPFDGLGALAHAYAMTIHKSQGSEFSQVILPLISGSPSFLTRKLLYTAITRAKDKLYLVGPWPNLVRMVRSDHDAKRRTGLKSRILAYTDLGI
ncbi:ATP-dependent RecD-like DNA helicase [Eubacterium aggregans]|uniref:SF1B family DNA helicase RecD2 n=1 Tax=Eubacterium aggregans TaxID=81409 RepID=UPI0023F2A657|nr:ATP-dependent RecD-like DNA helicase [Eubacterium aggregans]MDD4692370.1 ATP-dependent RecD-like DNA helicase [Eubacterium aggregans]